MSDSLANEPDRSAEAMEAMKREVAKLRDDTYDLGMFSKSEVETLRFENGQLRERNARLTNEVAGLRVQLEKYKDREAAVARMWHDPASQ